MNALKKIPLLISFLFIHLFISASLGVPELNIPPRTPGAPRGSKFAQIIWSLPLEQREQNIYNQVAAGNIPTFYRNLVPVRVSQNIKGKTHNAEFYVIPDYLAIGFDDDYFLMPMTPGLAQQIADLTSSTLPTRKMVNAIWSQAKVKLPPAPIPPSREMTTVKVFDQHNTMVWNQRKKHISSHPLGTLVAGDKKDIAITKRLHHYKPPPRVAIYGWHYPEGKPIQPLSLVHHANYADYSHGVRLVSLSMRIDGKETTVTDVLGDPELSILLSDEGPLTDPRYPVASPLAIKPSQESLP